MQRCSCLILDEHISASVNLASVVVAVNAVMALVGINKDFPQFCVLCRFLLCGLPLLFRVLQQTGLAAELAVPR